MIKHKIFYALSKGFTKQARRKMEAETKLKIIHSYQQQISIS